jgi:hypothetical protein
LPVQRFCSNGVSRFGGEVSISCALSNHFALQQLMFHGISALKISLKIFEASEFENCQIPLKSIACQ